MTNVCQSGTETTSGKHLPQYVGYMLHRIGVNDALFGSGGGGGTAQLSPKLPRKSPTTNVMWDFNVHSSKPFAM